MGLGLSLLRLSFPIFAFLKHPRYNPLGQVQPARFATPEALQILGRDSYQL